MATIAVTGSAAGIGAATVGRLRASGHRVIGVDLHDAEVVCDLGTPDGRADAVARVTELCGGRLDGLVTSAGLGPSSRRPAAPLISVNYFGTVALAEGLHPALAATGNASVVCLSSNSATCYPDWPVEVAEACRAGDERKACVLAEQFGGIATYPATKTAVAWFVRENAPTTGWAGVGVRLNAVAPGLIDTPMTAELRDDPLLGEAVSMFPTPRGSAGQPDEVAAVIEFLLGPGASLLFGSVLFCDGGTDALLHARDWPSVWHVDAEPV